MSKSPSGSKFVKLYHGYGHTHDLLLYGHVFAHKTVARKRYSTSPLSNIIYLLRLFFVKPVAHAPVELHWQGQVLENKTEMDGFIKFEWTSQQSVPAGWHTVQVDYKNGEGSASGTGELFVPHKTQYGFISDIDDTIMISHSATIFKDCGYCSPPTRIPEKFLMMYKSITSYCQFPILPQRHQSIFLCVQQRVEPVRLPAGFFCI